MQGILELHPKGYGFLRNVAKGYLAQQTDPFVEQRLIQKFKLRPGLLVSGPIEPNLADAGPRLRTVESIEGKPMPPNTSRAASTR